MQHNCKARMSTFDTDEQRNFNYQTWYSYHLSSKVDSISRDGQQLPALGHHVKVYVLKLVCGTGITGYGVIVSSKQDMK